MAKRGRPKSIVTKENVSILKHLSDYNDIICRWKQSIDDAAAECENDYENFCICKRALDKMSTSESNLFIVFLHFEKDYDKLSTLLQVDKKELKSIILKIRKKLQNYAYRECIL